MGFFLINPVMMVSDYDKRESIMVHSAFIWLRICAAPLSHVGRGCVSARPDRRTPIIIPASHTFRFNLVLGWKPESEPEIHRDKEFSMIISDNCGRVGEAVRAAERMRARDVAKRRVRARDGGFRRSVRNPEKAEGARSGGDAGRSRGQGDAATGAPLSVAC